jgi:hypothetical protein
MLYKISNNVDDIKDLLIKLKNEYGEYAFISYIDGEYGIRVWVYNSLCYEFYKNCKKREITVIGICFLNTKSFLRNCCDHVIEIQDVVFNTTKEKIISNTPFYQDYFTPPADADKALHCYEGHYYEGNDGWNLEYYRGVDCIEYENILDMLEFKNIFFTLHCAGAAYINKLNWGHVDSNLVIYKIDNNNLIINNIQNHMVNSFHIDNINSIDNKKIKKTICMWIRNTTKWPERNMQPYIYNSIFNYCISNKIVCYVFQDLIPVVLPINEYIIDSTDRYKNRPNFDNFLNICNQCDYYIGCDSGPTELISVHSNTYIKYINHVSSFILNHRNGNTFSILRNVNELY